MRAVVRLFRSSQGAGQVVLAMMSSVHINDGGRADELDAASQCLVRDTGGAGVSIFSAVMDRVAPHDGVAV